MISWEAWEGPGVYQGMPSVVYHGDPAPETSLSSSGARLLLAESPAKFHWQRTHPEPPKRVYDFGSAAHHMVLGVGPSIVPLPFRDFRTKAAQAARDEAYAAGGVPMLERELEVVVEMAAAIRRHPLASRLLDPGVGDAEVAIFWTDDPSGVTRRAMIDHLPRGVQTASGRLLVPDYKTAVSAETGAFGRQMTKLRYYQQAAWYEDAVLAAGLADDVQFLFVVQEKDPPYLVNVIQPDPAAMRIGRIQNREAVDLFAECSASGVWPGYGDEVHLAGVDVWLEREYEEG